MPCKFCFADFDNVKNYKSIVDVIGEVRANTVLTTKEVQALQYQISKNGITQMLLGGGDPFIRADMPDLIRFGHELGLEMVVDTNAKILSRKDGLLDSVAPYIHQLGLSLDGPTASIHNEFRGSQSFDNVMDVIKRSKDFDYLLKINTIVTRENIKEIPKIIALLEPYQDYINRLSFDQFIPSGRGENYKEKYSISDEEYRDVIEQLQEEVAKTHSSLQINGGSGKSKSGKVSMMGPQGVPYVPKNNKKIYKNLSIRTAPLSECVNNEELDITGMKERYSDSYYI